MLVWTLIFLVIALIAGVFGFGVASESAGIAQIVFGVFIALFIGSLAFGALRKR